MINVIIQLTGKTWIVIDTEGNLIASGITNGWYFITLCKVKKWNILNKSSLNNEISSKL